MKATVRLINHTTKISPFHAFYLGPIEVHTEDIEKDNIEEIKETAKQIAQKHPKFNNNYLEHENWRYGGAGTHIYQYNGNAPIGYATEASLIKVELHRKD